MSSIVPFVPRPAPQDPMRAPIELAAYRRGLTKAAAEGVTQSELQAVLNQDRPFASFALQLLGSPDAAESRQGRVMLGRLIGAPSNDPPAA